MGLLYLAEAEHRARQVKEINRTAVHQSKSLLTSAV